MQGLIACAIALVVADNTLCFRPPGSSILPAQFAQLARSDAFTSAKAGQSPIVGLNTNNLPGRYDR